MSFDVYILRSTSSGKFYVGHTADLDKRLTEHSHNQVSSTKNRGPWQLVYTEQSPTRSAASHREREIKAMKSHTWIEQLPRASR
jgi:putative endonuclease